MFSRDYEWRSGKKYTKIRNMSDTYLINVIAYVKHVRNMDDPENVALLDFLMHEAMKVRKLHKSFINMGPLPFKGADGNWAICDKHRFKITKLSHKTQREPSLDFDEDILSDDFYSDSFITDVNSVLSDLKNVLKFEEG